MPALRNRGFTLIEIMITVAILAIVASLAAPSYSAYVQRSRTPSALKALQGIASKMEQVYDSLNNNTYGVTGSACAIALGEAEDFDLSCTVDGSGTFLARAVGKGRMLGYEYTINHRGERSTLQHPKGANAACWTTKGTTCDV